MWQHMKNKPIIKTIGTGEPCVVLIGGMHGDEKVGIKVLKCAENLKNIKGTLKLIIANPPALVKNKRFIDADLNRMFPGKVNGNKEERLAFEILKEIKNADYVLDFHSCSVESKPFCIIRNKKSLKESFRTGLSHYVLLPLKKQGGKSCIDFTKCGIGLELGRHNSIKTINAGRKALINFLSSAGTIKERMITKKSQKNIFKIIGAIPKDKSVIVNRKVNNFKLISKNSTIGEKKGVKIKSKRDFYPILYGERAYDNILTFIGKKVSINV